MALSVTNYEITSNETAHRAWPLNNTAWVVSWLSEQTLDLDQAITAITLCEEVARAMNADRVGLVADHPAWPVIDSLAAELGVSGPNAVVRITEPWPETYQ